MSPTVNISSSAEFSKTLSSSTIVVADFYADWCGPCKAIAPTYESLSTKYSKPNRVTFTKVNVDQQQAVARQYGVTAMPTFMIFRSGSVIETIRGANPQQLTSAIDKAVKLAGPTTGSLYSTPGRTLGSGSGPTQGSSVYRRYNVQKIVDMLIAFFGLYFTTLFSLDAYQAAENSPFNVHKARSEPSGLGARSAQARTTGGASQSGRKLGTIADISGGN